MKNRRVYLILQAAVCCVLAALLAASVLSIYREGAARQALDPTAEIYTPRIISEKLAPIAPLFFASLGLLAAGLVLGIRDGSADKPTKAPTLDRDAIVGRVNHPSEAMRREWAAQCRLGWIGRGAFALCMIPVAAYLVNPGHFALELETMFRGLVWTLLPWTAVGLGALAVMDALRRQSAMREIEAAMIRIGEERAEGLSPATPPVVPPRKSMAIQTALLIAAAALIVAGILNGSARDVLYKAITICTECVGLG